MFINIDGHEMPKRLIARNRCQCLSCFDIIESIHRNDFVQCSCKKIFTDGGTDYIRRGYEYPDGLRDLTEFRKDDS